MRWLARVAAWLPMLALAAVVFDPISRAFGAEDRGELGVALRGTLALTLGALALALPIGLGAAVLLEALERNSGFARAAGAAFRFLAGLPAIVLGLAALELSLVVGRWPGRVTVALAVLALPTVVESARAALREVPARVRLASLALGASAGRVVWKVLLPAALPGLMAGTTLCVLRLFGETITLVLLGGLSEPDAPTLTIRALAALEAGDTASAGLALSVLWVLILCTSLLTWLSRGRLLTELLEPTLIPDEVRR